MVGEGWEEDEEQEGEKEEAEDSSENRSIQNNEDSENDEFIVEETEGQKIRSSEETDKVKKVDGPFESCTKTDYEGEHQQLLILHASHQLSQPH